LTRRQARRNAPGNWGVSHFWAGFGDRTSNSNSVSTGDPLATHCRVCGIDAGLGFGEGTPTSAYKGNPARIFGFDAWLIQGRDAPGPYTLCDECSDRAAQWYLPEFRRWTRIADDLISRGPAPDELDANPRPTWATAELNEVKPARFMKQVVTMLLAIARFELRNRLRLISTYVYFLVFFGLALLSLRGRVKRSASGRCGSALAPDADLRQLGRAWPQR